MFDQIIHKRLDFLQFGSNLIIGKFLIVKIEPAGYGAGLYRRLLGMKLAYIFNRTVIFDYSNALYPNCYQPTSIVSINDIANLPSSKLNFKKTQNEQIVYFDFGSYWKDTKTRHYIENWLPVELANSNKSLDYFMGQLLLRWHLLPEYQKYIEDTKKRLNFFGKIIGIHIRRGDKNVESPYVPMRIYNHYLKKAIKETGIKKIFLTSDSEEIISDLPQNIDLEYIYDREEKRYNNANHQFVRENPDAREQETKTAVKIIHLLGECDYVVGQKNTYFTYFANIKKEATNLKNRTYFVNRQYHDISFNNDYKPWFYIWDIFKKWCHFILQKIVRIFTPLIKDKELYNKIKSWYYGRKIS